MKKTTSLNLKFSPGDIVYYVMQKSIPTYQKCSTCLGEGTLDRADGSSITCPICKGKKQITNSGSLNFVVEKGTVEEVYITVNENYIDTEYKLKDTDGLRTGLYSTEEEAEKSMPQCICGYGTT